MFRFISDNKRDADSRRSKWHLCIFCVFFWGGGFLLSLSFGTNTRSSYVFLSFTATHTHRHTHTALSPFVSLALLCDLVTMEKHIF